MVTLSGIMETNRPITLRDSIKNKCKNYLLQLDQQDYLSSLLC